MSLTEQTGAFYNEHRVVEAGHGFIKYLCRNLTALLEKAKSIVVTEEPDAADEEVDSSPESDVSDAEDHVVHPIFVFEKDIHAHVTCLMDLVPTLEQIITTCTGRNIENRCNMLSLRVTEAAGPYVLHIQEKFKSAPIALTERLGQANGERYVRIRDQMERPHVKRTQDGPQHVFSRSGFAPVSRLHDFDTGSSKWGIPCVPPMPVEATRGLPFECFICKETLTHIMKRSEWEYVYIGSTSRYGQY